MKRSSITSITSTICRWIEYPFEFSIQDLSGEHVGGKLRVGWWTSLQDNMISHPISLPSTLMGLDKKRPAWITTSIYTDYWLVWLYLLTFEISCATAARWRFLVWPSSVITLSLGMMLIEWRQVFKVHWPSLNSYYTSCHSYANALVTRSISLHDTLAYMQCKSSAWFQNRCAWLLNSAFFGDFPARKFKVKLAGI